MAKTGALGKAGATAFRAVKAPRREIANPVPKVEMHEVVFKFDPKERSLKIWRVTTIGRNDYAQGMTKYLSIMVACGPSVAQPDWHQARLDGRDAAREHHWFVKIRGESNRYHRSFGLNRIKVEARVRICDGPNGYRNAIVYPRKWVAPTMMNRFPKHGLRPLL
jgi:hypothetical protein